MKIEIRADCKTCGSEILSNRFRTFCRAECRNKFYNKKYSKVHTDWQRKRRDEIASVPDPDKIQCLVCGKWYIQICTHAYQVHGLLGREYREKFDLEVKRGVVPAWYRELKGDQAIDNETYKNLEAGAKYRFHKGQKGVGIYHRAPATMARLKDLYKWNKL